MDLSGLKDLKTTIPGIIVLAGATYAMLKGLCTWEQWWQAVLIILAAIGGGGLLLTGGKKETPQ